MWTMKNVMQKHKQYRQVSVSMIGDDRHSGKACETRVFQADDQAKFFNDLSRLDIDECRLFDDNRCRFNDDSSKSASLRRLAAGLAVLAPMQRPKWSFASPTILELHHVVSNPHVATRSNLNSCPTAISIPTFRLSPNPRLLRWILPCDLHQFVVTCLIQF